MPIEATSSELLNVPPKEIASANGKFFYLSWRMPPYINEFDKKRVETFIDAILAIILTILVLEFRVPRLSNPTTITLQHELKELLPAVLSYIISFWTVIALWLDHHHLFKVNTRMDKNFVLLNFFFVLCLAPLPFTTAFAGEYINNSFAVALVASNYLLMNVAFAFVFYYGMASKAIPPEYFQNKTGRINNIISVAGLGILAVSIPVAYVNTYITFGLCILVVIGHLLKR